MATESVDAQYVLDHEKTMPLIDVRPHQLFVKGHIPGAHNVDLEALRASGGDATEKFIAALAAVGVHPHDKFIIYCNRGRLTREAIALLEPQGFDGIHAYLGSWIDWVLDPSRPIES